MKLKDIRKKMTSESMNNALQEKFGYRVNLDTLPLDRAQKILLGVEESLVEAVKKGGEKIRKSKAYAEKIMVRETLRNYVAEKREKIRLEQRSIRLRRRLQEAEAQEAEVILAARDMVDRIQKMVEDLGEMQNEQLLPLVDSIRTTLGQETATSFESSMSTAISSAMDACRQARTDADNAARVLSGDTPVGADNMMGGDMDDLEVPGDEMDADAGLASGGIGGDEPAEPVADPEMGDGDRQERDVELDMSNL